MSYDRSAARLAAMRQSQYRDNWISRIQMGKEFLGRRWKSAATVRNTRLPTRYKGKKYKKMAKSLKSAGGKFNRRGGSYMGLPSYHAAGVLNKLSGTIGRRFRSRRDKKGLRKLISSTLASKSKKGTAMGKALALREIAEKISAYL